MYILNFTGCVIVFREVWFWYIFTTHNAVNNDGKCILLICSVNLESTKELTTWVTEGPKFLSIHINFSHEKFQI